MVTTAGGTGLLTGLQCVLHRWPIRLFSVLQTEPLVGAQLEVNDVFDVDVSPDKAAPKKKGLPRGKNASNGLEMEYEAQPTHFGTFNLLSVYADDLFKNFILTNSANSCASSWILFVCVSSFGSALSYHIIFLS